LSRPPEQPVFFLDENLDADSVYEALVQAGAKVERHRDHFKPGTPDVDWLPVVGKNGWTLLTKDAQIRRNDLELNALMHSGVGAFMLTMKDMKGAEIGARIVEALGQMGNVIRKMAKPFIYGITKTDVREIRGSGRKAAQKKDAAPEARAEESISARYAGDNVEPAQTLTAKARG
jgi:hypothetical protein